MIAYFRMNFKYILRSKLFFFCDKKNPLLLHKFFQGKLNKANVLWKNYLIVFSRTAEEVCPFIFNLYKVISQGLFKMCTWSAWVALGFDNGGLASVMILAWGFEHSTPLFQTSCLFVLSFVHLFMGRTSVFHHIDSPKGLIDALLN